MANKWLKGNGYWCEACRGTGRGELSDIIEYSGGGECRFYKNCPVCNGQKRIAVGPGTIIAGDVPITRPPRHHSIFLQTIEYRAGF